MADKSKLTMFGGIPKGRNIIRAAISGRITPDISVDVGQVLRPDSSPPTQGAVLYADSDTASDARAIGVAISAGEVGDIISIVYSGPVSLTTAQWDRVTGGSGGLLPGVAYYVSPTLGGLTDDPSITGFTAQVGVALSTTTLLVNPQAPFVTPP